MPASVLYSYGALCLIWGSTWLFIKIGLGSLPPVLLGGLRFGLAALALLCYIGVLRLKLPRRGPEIWPAALYGCMQASGSILALWGQVFIASGRASVLNALSPIFVVLLAAPMLGDRLTWLSVGSALLGLGGVAVMGTAHGHGAALASHLEYLGEVLIIASAAVYAVANVFAKKYLPSSGHPAVIALIETIGAAVLLLLVASFWEPVAVATRFTPSALIAIFYLALVGLAFPTILYFYCLKHLKAAELSILNVVYPVVALALGAMFLRESIGLREILGTVLILGSVLLMYAPHFKRRRMPKKAASPQASL